MRVSCIEVGAFFIGNFFYFGVAGSAIDMGVKDTQEYADFKGSLAEEIIFLYGFDIGYSAVRWGKQDVFIFWYNSIRVAKER